MFGDVFVFILKCISQLFGVLKTFKLGNGLTFYSFLVFLAAIPLFLRLLSHIRKDNIEDQRFLYTMRRYDEYRDYRNNLKKMSHRDE